MKTLPQVLSLALIGACIMVLNFGCASTSSGTHELTLKETAEQVEDAMLTYRNASIAGALTTAQHEGIQNAYNQYKAIYGAAVAKAGSDQDAASPDNLKVAAENVIARVDALP